MKYYYLLSWLLLLQLGVRAQNVGIGTTTPNAAAALDITAAGKGLLIPRLDSATRAAISSPPVGLMVYQTNGRTGFWYYTGAAWAFIPDKLRSGDNLGNHTATQNLNLAGNQLVGGTATAPGTAGLSIDGNGLARLTMTGTRPINTYDNGLGLQVLNADAGFLVRTTIGYGPASPPVSGSGDRLMWTSYYGSFRAGGVDGSQWDSSNMGFYSAAFGYNNTAAGNYSLTAGYNNLVRGSYSTALGANSAVDQNSTAGFAFGRNCRVGGNSSVAGGYFTKAQGTSALALGERCVANANYAIALGRYASAGGYSGTLTLGDGSSTDTVRAAANNQFSARYAGGYRLYSSAARTTGVQLAAGDNSWSVISDSTKKERRVLADGNRFLASIGAMRLGSWNYKDQSPDTMRHYGPMAQDFYAAFGHDGVGRSGNATSINQADFDGVNLIAIQALYRRVLALEAANARLSQRPRRQAALALQARAEAAEAKAAQVTATLATFEARLRQLEAASGGQASK